MSLDKFGLFLYCGLYSQAAGEWMKINKEAIYNTTPWVITSENVSDATLSNAVVHDAEGDVTSKVILPDIYFTANGKTIYAIARSWKESVIAVQSLAKGKYGVQSVELLGTKKKIEWKQTNEALMVMMPAQLSVGIPVYVFKVTLQ